MWESFGVARARMDIEQKIKRDPRREIDKGVVW